MNKTTNDTKSWIDDVGRSMADGNWIDVLKALSPDVVAHVPAVGELKGADAIATFLFETADKTEDGEHFELIDVLVGEQYAALYFRITAKRGGRPPLDNLTLHLARIGDEVIEEIWFHNFDTRAVAEFWA